MALLWRLAHSPFGRAIQAVRDNEQRAASLGYNVYLRELADHHGGDRRLYGALLTLMLQVSRRQPSWQHAGDSLLMTVLGGVHHFLGPLWGAIAFIVSRTGYRRSPRTGG
jgi:ABC-type branched-subunit amino acid transport system permease subunit